MRVLGIASYGNLGGSQVRLATFLEHRPAHVDPEVLLVTDGALRSHLEERGIPTLVARGYEGKPTLARALRFTRSLSAHLARRRPDVVWAMAAKAALLAAPACRLHGVPLVWHRVDFSFGPALALPLAAASSGVVAPSRALLDPLGPLRSLRVLGKVDPPLRLGDVTARPDPERPVIGTLARLVPYKGHHHIIRAAALLSEEFPTLRVVLAGDDAPEYPAYRDELNALAGELGIADRVDMPGFVEPAGVLERLSVFVNATYRDEEGFGLEGLSGAMLEASWAGVPVVAARGGGTAEGMEDGLTGTLVKRPDPELLAGAIGPYLRDPERAAAAGAAGRELARRRFAPEAASARLFELLESVARPQPAPSRAESTSE
jgi:colanic acid/amylovoran biosynthesis glycosyltransferase